MDEIKSKKLMIGVSLKEPITMKSYIPRKDQILAKFLEDRKNLE